eukprot:gene9573-8553_t
MGATIVTADVSDHEDAFPYAGDPSRDPDRDCAPGTRD